MGDTPCPDCGAACHDPVTGLCSCDPVLWRVAAYSTDRLADPGELPWDVPSATVATRYLPAEVARVAEGSQLVVVQRVDV